jgi:hypothetical protein
MCGKFCLVLITGKVPDRHLNLKINSRLKYPNFVKWQN